MSIATAEVAFQRGLSALVDQRPALALKHFRAAMACEKEERVPRPEMRYLSYYGLSLARSSKPTHEAIRACESAVERDGRSAVLYLNLGRVYALAGRRTRAIQALQRGLELDPEHRAIRIELRRLDRRSSPVVGGLDRDHPVNVWLGKARARITPRR